MKSKLFLLLILTLSCSFFVNAQPVRTMVEVRVMPDREDWSYKSGEEITFKISVVRNGAELRDVTLHYWYGEEKMVPVKKSEVVYNGGTFRVKAGSYRKPGFVTCEAYVEVDGKKYEGIANVAVDPAKIKAFTEMPSDFRAFWEAEKAKLKKIPLAPVITPLPERATQKSNVYHVSFQNHREGARIFGILSVPKAGGKYPAILNVPGAGVRPYEGDTYLADDGFISLTIGIHGVPVTMEKEIYDNLFKSILDKYWIQNMDDRDEYFYKRVYLGCVRAVDFIYTLPEFDGKFIAVSGGSQGGALAIVTASLDERISCLTSFYPALCDLAAFTHGRAAGWPMLFRDGGAKDPLVAAKIATSRYFDVVNFARSLKTPGFYSWGYNDVVCPPSSVYAAYNEITAPKELFLSLESGHWNFPEQWEKKQAFIKRELRKSRP